MSEQQEAGPDPGFISRWIQSNQQTLRWNLLYGRSKRKFAAQVEAALLGSVRQLAKSEARQIIKVYLKSAERFSGLYKQLAQ